MPQTQRTSDDTIRLGNFSPREWTAAIFRASTQGVG
jgi:hypothetical protein